MVVLRVLYDRDISSNSLCDLRLVVIVQAVKVQLEIGMWGPRK